MTTEIDAANRLKDALLRQAHAQETLRNLPEEVGDEAVIGATAEVLNARDEVQAALVSADKAVERSE